MNRRWFLKWLPFLPTAVAAASAIPPQVSIPNNLPEVMSPSAVNDMARAIMAGSAQSFHPGAIKTWAYVTTGNLSLAESYNCNNITDNSMGDTTVHFK